MIQTQQLSLFDTHCHLDFDVFRQDFPHHLESAIRQGVKKFVIPSVGIQNWQRVESLAGSYPDILYYGLGIHPYFLSQESAGDPEKLEKHLTDAGSACVAIGECGLDAMIDQPASLQEGIFVAQLEMAKQVRLPVIIHSRKTHDRVIALLKQTRFSYGGVLHGFSGSYQQACALIDAGLKIGVGGVITYPRATKTRRAISLLPEDKLVLETDAPDMPVYGFQGQPNHPGQLNEILRALAGLQQKSPQILSDILWRNSLQLFGLSE